MWRAFALLSRIYAQPSPASIWRRRDMRYSGLNAHEVRPLAMDTSIMPTILLDEPQRLIAWAEKRLAVRFFDDARVIGWGDQDEVRAVAVYERWSCNDCSVHLVSDGRPGWLSRRFLAAGFHYPFVTAGLRRITGLVPADNHKAIRLNRHFGYREEGRLRFAAENGSDLIIMGMLREECIFIPKEFRHG